jgi:hypothetical protein
MHSAPEHDEVTYDWLYTPWCRVNYYKHEEDEC